MKLNENIKRLRIEKKFTQEELGKKISVSKQTVQRYESGIIPNVPYDKIEILAKVFDCSPAVLMGWETEKATSPKYSSPIQALLNKSEKLNTDGINELNKYADYLLSQKQYQKIQTQEMAM